MDYKPQLSFYSRYSDELALKFDGVVGNDVMHNFPLHIHNSLCIGLITKGQRNMIWADKSETINQDELFIINKYQPHAIEQLKPHSYIAITIKGETGNTVFENVIKSGCGIDIFYQLFGALKEKKLYLLPKKWLCLHQYISQTDKQLETLSFNDDFIRKSIAYIQANHQQQILVGNIAEHVCMSTWHFCRLFKKLTGLSPHNYLKQYRLSQSYKHLQQNTPVFDTAIETGFYDSSHFIKTFYAYMAVSPKEYQASVTTQ